MKFSRTRLMTPFETFARTPSDLHHRVVESVQGFPPIILPLHGACACKNYGKNPPFGKVSQPATIIQFCWFRERESESEADVRTGEHLQRVRESWWDRHARVREKLMMTTRA